MTRSLLPSARLLWRRPFRAGLVASLSGGCLALSAAVFAVIDGTVFKPLPLPEADRLVRIGRVRYGNSLERPGPVSLGLIRDLSGVYSLDAVAGWTSGVVSADEGGDEDIRSVAVTPGFLEMLAVRPFIGRFLSSADVPSGGLVPVVLGNALWRSRHGADPAVIGTEVRLAGIRCLVVGVASAGFDMPYGANVWSLAEERRGVSNFSNMSAIARVRPGASCPTDVSGTEIACEPLRLAFSSRSDPALPLVLAGAVLLVVMTWVQVICLELARVLTRSREFGVRLAIGATRNVLLAESLVQSGVVGLVSLGFAAVMLPPLLAWLVRLLPPELSLGQPIAADGRALLFGAVLSIGVGVAYAVLPLQALFRVGAAHLLRGIGKAGPVAAPWLIVVGQVALSVVLVYLASLAARSAHAVSRVDLGYEPEGVVVARLPRPAAGDLPVDYSDAAGRISALPGIAAVAGSDGRPLGGGTTVVTVELQGQVPGVRARMVCVTPGYFRALGVRLLEGRDFADFDIRGSHPVAVVNRPLARRLGLETRQTGTRIVLLGRLTTLVGIVGDTVLTRPDDPDREAVFVPTAQWVAPTYLIARSASGPAGRSQTLAGVSAVLRQMATPGSYRVMALEDEARRVTAGYRARMILLVGLGVVGLVLCATGVYGAVAYAANGMRRPIAIRLALGATPATVRLHFLRTVTFRVVSGLGTGVLAGVAAGRTGAAMLFGTGPMDGVSIAVATLTVVGACACASVPAVVHAGRLRSFAILREE